MFTFCFVNIGVGRSVARPVPTFLFCVEAAGGGGDVHACGEGGDEGGTVGHNNRCTEEW